jgi:hypothetical protein
MEAKSLRLESEISQDYYISTDGKLHIERSVIDTAPLQAACAMLLSVSLFMLMRLLFH